MNLLKGIAAALSRAGSSAVSVCVLLFVTVLFCGGGEALAAPRHINYLQVAANEGDSSGGHTALRFGAETFHFQHETSGMIRIHRLDSKTFDHMYAVLGNRAIQESWIEVSEETYTLLLDGFSQLLIIQDEQMRVLDSLRRDVALFEFLLDGMEGPRSRVTPASFLLNRAGYFIPDEQLLSGSAIDEHAGVANSVSRSSRALNDLKARVGTVYGENFIDERIALARVALRELKLAAAQLPFPELSVDSYPVFTLSASSVFADTQVALFALELLQTGAGLMPGSFWSPVGSTFQLTQEESRHLRSFAVKLEGDLFRLLNSSRSDWAFAFIVGMARLAAIEASLSSGTLVFLDIYSDVEPLQRPQSPSGMRYLPAMKREAEELFLLKRNEFFVGQDMREADFAAFELLGNNLLELQRSIENNVQPRQLPEAPLPSRPAKFIELIRPDMSAADLKLQLETARSAEKAYANAISNLYEYDLLRRNCVTEIFAFIDRSLMRHAGTSKQSGQSEMMPSSENARNESLQRLGGYVDPSEWLNFIPVVSAAEVDACYRVTVKREQPSYRAIQLAEMKTHESSLLVFLRESNTITSTIYQRPPDDSPFLFFTDDTFFLRPVFGAFNLLVGVGESLLGLVTLPIEGTNRLYLGAKGVLFSLPELVFVSLRKGTMEYVAENNALSQ